MKKLAWLLVLTLVLAPLTGCSGSDSDDSSSGGNNGDNSYNMNNVPSKYSIDIPESLKASESSRSLTRAGEPSQSCMMLKQNVSSMQFDTMNVAMMAVLADAAIEQNSISPDEAIHDVEVTLTQPMVDKIFEIMGDDAEMMAGINEAVGTVEKVAITYTDSAAEPYKYEIDVESDNEDDGLTCTLSWNEDKTKTKLYMPIKMATETDGGGNYSEEDGSCTIIYDGETGLQTSNYDSSLFKMDISLQTKGEGVILYSNTQMEGNSYKLEGYADDNGGYLVTTIISQGQAPMVMNESFDAAGNIIENNSTYSDTYGDYSAEVTDLSTNLGVSVPAANISDGEYVVLNAEVVDQNFFGDSLVGFAVVQDGNCIIQDIGGSAFGEAMFESCTLYLYKMTPAAETVTFSETAETLAYTPNVR